MKTGRLSLLSMAGMLGVTMLVTGCTATDGLEEDSGAASANKITVRATNETRTSADGDVRTTLGSNYEVLWSPDDSFMIYTTDGNYYSALIIEEGAGTTNASFTGPGILGNSFVAIYGSNPYCMYSGTASFTAMPEQTYRADGFSNNVNPMLAYTDDLEKGLSFSNVMGILELNVTGTKTVDRITVSCDGMALSGKFTLAADLSDLTLTPDAQNVASEVSLVNIGETLDASTPKHFNVVVPPGTYENLKIRIVNTDGTYVERTAPEPITVARNQIVPLMGLVDGDEAQQAPVRITVEPYAWYGCTVYADMYPECEMFYILVASESAIMQWKIQNPGKSELDMVIGHGSLYDRNYAYAHEDKAGETLHVYAQAINANYEPVGPMMHASFEIVPPLDDSLFAQAYIMDNTMTETSVSVAFDCTADVQNVKSILMQNQSIYPDMDSYLYYTCAYPQYVTSISDGSGRLDITDLVPGRDYWLLYVAESADGRITLLQIIDFSSPEHVASNALVTISENSVEDIRASFNIAMNSSAVSYKAMLLTAQQYNELAGEGLADIVAADVSEPMMDPVYTVTGLSPETDYVLAAVAYDSGGVYGSLSVLPFRTTAYIAVEDPVYDSFIGEWAVDYVDYNTGVGVSDGFRVTISPDVEGKTFLIDGLVGGASNPVVAEFVDNGLRLKAGMNLYPMSETSYVVLGLLTDVSVYVGTYTCIGSVYDDIITFAGYDMPYEFKGFVFYVYDMQTGEYPGYVEPFVQNPVFRRVAAQ